MDKQQYKNLINETTWQWVKNYFDSIENYEPSVLCSLDINPKQWIEFSVEHFEYAEQNYEFIDNTTDLSKRISETNVKMGRNEHNSGEINYGKHPESNNKMISLLVANNLAKLNVLPQYILCRLLVKFPGHGVAWHVDTAKSFGKYYPELNIDQDTHSCQHGQIVRYWFPVTDWCTGHMFQISNTVLWKYKQGQVFKIPFGQGHASSNAGFEPQFSVSLTGILSES